MSDFNPAAAVFGFVVLVVTVELLRRRQLREKYAALWIAVSLVTVIVAVFPGLLRPVASLLGFVLPANLVFLGGGIVLAIISMQLSLETGRLEDESQRLAEEVALLRFEVDQLRAVASPPDPGARPPAETGPADPRTPPVDGAGPAADD